MNTTRLTYKTSVSFRRLRMLIVSLFALVFFNSCGSLIATYDHYAYTQTIDIKVEVLHLMEQAGEPFISHRDEVETLQMKIEKAYEYEKGRPKNEITVAMWEKFTSPDRFLFGGFIKRWKEKETLPPVFISESKKTVGTAIDQIIGLESGKIKKTELKN